ncbi:cupredoxin domain-containing protein [Sphingomonas flavalba]|uniref:cupredoxin domain-containing protein n=1 Tax=Sphingomonas flavalba TaxID=2559804 RepID=UPI0039E1E2FD
MRAPHPVLLALASAALTAAPAPLLAAGKTYVVTMKAMAFGPVPAGLRVGDTIEWVNDDVVRHTATAANKSFDVDLQPKARGRTLLTAAGVFPFVCRFHPGMKGVLRVARQ